VQADFGLGKRGSGVVLDGLIGLGTIKPKRGVDRKGFEVPAMLSFGEEVEANVARIAPQSLEAAARALKRQGQVDCVFLSCTNLRSLSIIQGLENELGVPVLSSNQVLAWHLAKLSNIELFAKDAGRLMSD
jgi:maleate isomerase